MSESVDTPQQSDPEGDARVDGRALYRAAAVALGLSCLAWFCNPGGGGTVVGLAAAAFVFSEISRSRRATGEALPAHAIWVPTAAACLAIVIALTPVAPGLLRFAGMVLGLR